MTQTVRLTTAQALVKFLSHQFSERDGVEQRLVTGILGIFGHGNVAGVGQALLQAQVQDEEGADGDDVLGDLPYYLARNEQGAVHTATAFSRARHRRQVMAVTTSIGPGATNMVTGAALATTNRIPVLLLPSDQFANRVPDPVLQQLEDPGTLDVSVNDVFRPVSRFFDRINRPEQLVPSLMNAMRVLTDPADTGAVTVCLPQDVQAEAHDWPLAFFTKRVWHIGRPVPEPAALERALAAIRSAERPLVVAGGGVVYSEASEDLRAFATATGIPVCDTHAGKGAINWDHPSAVGGVGSTGSSAANELARKADVVIGIGTRYSDFTTASHTIFAADAVRFVNVNVLGFDAAKHGATMLVADAREALRALTSGLEGWQVDDAYRQEAVDLDAAWQKVVDECYHRDHIPLPAQTEVFGALNELMGPKDVVINAAGSMPGDLQCLWRASTPEQYHVEYAFSCMGYEIPASLGVKMAVGDEHAGRGDRRGRHVPDAADGDRDDRLRGRQGDHRAPPEPRLRLDRRALRVAGFAALWYEVPHAAELDGAPGRGERPLRPRRQRGLMGGRRAALRLDRRVPRQLRPGRRVRPHHGPVHRDRPHGPQPAGLGLVGRARLAGVRPGVDAAGLCRARGAPARAATVPLTCPFADLVDMNDGMLEQTLDSRI